MEMKKCTKCGVEYPATSDYFYKSKASKIGLKSHCKICAKEMNKINHVRYYENNKEKVNAKNLENYYKKHPKEIIADGCKKCSICEKIKSVDKFGKQSKSKDGYKYSCKECRRTKEYESVKKTKIAKQKLYYEQNKKMILEKEKVSRKKNGEHRRLQQKKYYLENSDKIKERSKQYLYNRIETDTGFKILQRCRSRLYKAVKGYVKSAKTKELIGCNVEQLLKHLESQFTEGMTWDNYGEWHIDHIMPCSSFDFNIKENQFKCFNYTNLQPLWAEENFKKNNKINIQ